MLSIITAEQAAEWEAYDTLEPVGSFQYNYMAGMICAVIVNILQAVFRGKGQRPKPVSPFDFLPEWGMDSTGKKPDAPAKAQSAEEMKDLFKQIASSRPKKRKGPDGR